MDEEKLKNSIEAAADTLSRYEEAKKDEKLSDMVVVKKVQHKQILLSSDLPEDLIAEILSRVHLSSLRSVRSTCKEWNVLSRNLVIGKVAEAKTQLLGFMIIDLRICALRIDPYDGDDFGNLSVKQVSGVDQIKIYKAYHCDGLLLCLYGISWLLVWNPYLGQRRWILRDKFNPCHMFALGYDNNRNLKILGIFILSLGKEFSDMVFGFNIYEFNSNSWRRIDVTFNRRILDHVDPVTVERKCLLYYSRGDAYGILFILF